MGETGKGEPSSSPLHFHFHNAGKGRLGLPTGQLNSASVRIFSRNIRLGARAVAVRVEVGPASSHLPEDLWSTECSCLVVACPPFGGLSFSSSSLGSFSIRSRSGFLLYRTTIRL